MDSLTSSAKRIFVIAANRAVAEDHFARLGVDPPDYILIRNSDDARWYTIEPDRDTVIRLTFDNATDSAWFDLTIR